MYRNVLAMLACSGEPAAPTDGWAAPANEWPSGAPPSDLVGEGFGPGEVVPDLRLPDQHDHEVALWQFSGRVLLVTVGAVWCAPCRDLAVEARPMLEDLADDGVVHVTILEEDASGLDPDVGDAAEWASLYGDDAPVLADTVGALRPAVAGAYPVVLVVGRDLVVVDARIAPTVEELRALLVSAL